MNPKESMTSPEEIEFHFIKSNHFRTIHCDGILGSTGSDWATHLMLFSERAAIPKKIVLKMNDGELSDEVEEKREGKQGFVRDVEANAVLSLDAAIELYNWLQTHLEKAVEAGVIEMDNQTGGIDAKDN